MKKIFLTSAIFLIAFSFLTGCESSTKRREFCDCVDIAKMLTDGLTLSEVEKEEKKKGCEWIEKEMSQIKMMEEMAKCYNKK